MHRSKLDNGGADAGAGSCQPAPARVVRLAWERRLRCLTPLPWPVPKSATARDANSADDCRRHVHHDVVESAVEHRRRGRVRLDAALEAAEDGCKYDVL